MGELIWLDQTIRYRRRSGATCHGTPLDLIAGHRDPDPIVEVDLGHPSADAGFLFLMRDLFQAALPAADIESWIRRFFEPPTPDEVRAAFAPFRGGLDLVHPVTPMFQVRPAPERLQAAAKPAGKRKKPPRDNEEDEEEDEVEAVSIAALLPDAPTLNSIKNDNDFFSKRLVDVAIGAGTIVPIIYANMILFPSSGGGYLDLPHGSDSIKYLLVGRTLWETIWFNVLIPCEQPEFHPADTRPIRPEAVFPWLDPTLADLPLGRRDEGAERPVRRIALHPAAIPMTRRYLLSDPEPGRCDLTGIEGPVFRGFRRWPKGLRYEPDGWWFPPVSMIETGDAKPGTGPRFVRARGPLRFDDWLETALLSEGTGKARRHLPFALRQWEKLCGKFDDARPGAETATGEATALTPDSAFRVRAFAQYPFGKAVGGFSARELPLWRHPPGGDSPPIAAIEEILEKLYKAADCLAVAARMAIKLGRTEGNAVAADDLRDGFLAALDEAVVALPARLARLSDVSTDPDQRQRTTRTELEAVLTLACRRGIEMFDGAFPLGGGTLDEKIAAERAKLSSQLRSVLLGERSGQSGKGKKGKPS